MVPPRFSILLPTHNRTDVLPLAIASVLAQTEQDFELLVVGDGCSDNTADVVRGVGDSRVVWIDLPKAPNFGYANRNIALRRARGRFVAFMPHDDLWFPDHLELLGSTLEESGAELAYSLPLLVSRDGLITPQLFNLNVPSTMDSFMARRVGFPAASVVHTRDCFEKYGYWNEVLPRGGDHDLWIR